VVRVVNRVTNNRILINGMSGAVVNLSFTHTKEEVVVGAMDSQGNFDSLGKMFVYKVM
jgi:hypothetical protein